MKEKLKAIGITIVSWLCFYSAILAPKSTGVPVTLDFFGVYELPIVIPFILLWDLGIFNIEIAIRMFLFIVLPVIMGVLFIYYTCIYLYAPKIKIVTVTQEEVERMKLVIDELKNRGVPVAASKIAVSEDV